MKRLLLLLIIASSVQAAKNAHPRMILGPCGGTTPCLGAADGTTSGSLRWKAVQHKTDWEQFRSDAEHILTSQTGGAACTSPGVGWGGANGVDYGMTLTTMAIVLDGMSVSTDTPYSAAQYANCADVLTESYHTSYIVPLCPGGNYANCDSCNHLPWGDGNKYRQQSKFYALVYDWLSASSTPPSSGHKTDWYNDLHQSAESVTTNFCSAGSPDKTNFNAGVGPAQNINVSTTTYMIGVATYGDNATDTTTCPTYGSIHETQCNDETIRALKDWYNNFIPWWTANTLGPNSTNRCQPPKAPATAYDYAGGSGCGAGGTYTDALEYFPQAQRYVMNILDASVNADNPSINLWSTLPSSFANEQISYLLYATSPTFSKRWLTSPADYMYELDNEGDQQGLYVFDNNLQTSMQILAKHIGTGAYANYARFWADSIYKDQSTGATLYGIYPGHSSLLTSWVYFLYEDDTGATRTDYRTALSNAYHATGEDLTISFATPKGSSCAANSMACPDATWAVFANREANSNHAHAMSGEFNIWRNSAWLALGPAAYYSPFYFAVSADTHNQPLYQGPTELAGGYFKGADVFPKSGVSEFSNANELNPPYYVYSWVDMTGNYKNIFSSNPTKVQREWIHFYPDRFVILDRGTFTSAASGRFQMNGPGAAAPTTSAGITTMTAPGNNDGLGGANQLLFITPLFPASQTVATAKYDGTITTVREQNTNYTWGSAGFPSSGASTGIGYIHDPYYRYTGTTPSTSTAFVMLNGMEAANAGATATTSEAITPTGLICDHWKDSSRDDIACFSSDTGGALLTLPLATYTFTPSASNSRHIIVDMPISTSVYVHVTRGGTDSYTVNTTSSGGTAMTTSTQGVLAFNDSGAALTQLNPNSGAVCGITGPVAGPLANGTIGISYTPVTVTTANCTSPTFSLTAGAPAGIVIGSSSGIISGTPTGPAQNNSFSVNITDANGNTSNNYSININNPAAAPGTSVVGGKAAFGGKSNH